VAATEIGDWKAASPPDALKLGMRTFARRALIDAADLEEALAQESTGSGAV
jgi:hypothetical protein